jgi:hypothetical protein
MRYSTWCANLLGVALLLIVSAGSAQAQATRTWVSGVGDDANPCSRTAPCKTFAGAISKTAAGGEINVLDPGGFGAVTITKSITISSEGFEAGVLVSGTNGIIVNGAGAVVILRGLDIQGVGTGLAGISFLQGSALHVEKCVIRGFNGGVATGINFVPSAASELYVSDTIISENGTGPTGGGIIIKPTGATNITATITATITAVKANNNVLGIRVDGTGSTGVITASITNSETSGNTFAGITSFTPVGGATTRVIVSNSVVEGNGTGLNANGATATLRIGTSIISHNATAFSIANSATMTSFGTNEIVDNPSGASPAIPPFGPG